jgi:uncharacterized protein YlxP (DUF503 family)
MFIGVGRYELLIASSRSLKDKRQVLRSISSQVANKFNVSIAEVDYQNLWQRAAFGVSCVAESTGHCRRMLMEVEKTMARAALGGAEIISRSVEVISMDDL